MAEKARCHKPDGCGFDAKVVDQPLRNPLAVETAEMLSFLPILRNLRNPSPGVYVARENILRPENFRSDEGGTEEWVSHLSHLSHFRI
jgi:hypothetical protein